MQRSLWLLSAVGFAALLSACAPDIPQNPQTPYVTIEFNLSSTPAVVPQPNNLAINDAGLVFVPPGPDDTPTTTAFNETYLDTLDGFPMETTATVGTSGDVTPSTLATGILVLDITNPAAPLPAAVTSTYVSGGADAGGTIVINPTSGQWTRGHTYAGVVVGGNQTGAFAAVTGSASQQVIGSSTWALVASTSNCSTVASCGPIVPLCVLPDGGPGGPNSGCTPTTDLIQPASDAPQLQELQNGYAPLLGALAGAPFNIPRSNVAILWTFSITTQAEVTFNPANTIIPFPNAVLQTGPNDTVSLPVPPGTPPVLAELIGGLNTLDGFSTTATITTAVDFSLPNNGVSALMQGSVDPQTLTPQLAINLVKVLTSVNSAASQGPVNVAYCLSDVPPGCPQVTATLSDGGPKPEILGIVPLTPLDERTTYAAYMTNSIKDTSGKQVIPSAIFALVRLPASTAPLYANGHSQVPSLLSDTQAQELGQLQSGLAALFADLEGQGIPYTNVVQAWAFKTQSEQSQLQQLAAIPYNPAGGGFPGNPLWVENVTAAVLPGLAAAGVPTANIGTIYAGEIIDPFFLTGPTGTFNPDGGIDPVPIPFIMTVPTAAPPAAGYPVSMFGHGLGGNKTNAYAIASAMATAGQVMIAIDEVWHGARNTCTGFGAYADGAEPGAGPLPDGGFPDFAICTTALTALTECNAVGRCQLVDRSTVGTCTYGTPTADETCFNLGQNECAPDGKCEGSDFNEAYSGWNLLNLANLFATRDNFRQQVIDNSQFARVASGSGAGSLPALTAALNAGAISYSGQSLGGILGTLYTSVAFNVQNAGLDVPGGNPVNILLTSPAFVPLLVGFNDGLAEAGIETNSPTYDLFIDIARWILDPADPTNAAYYTINPTGLPSVAGGSSIPATRRTFVQWIVGDEVVPNPTALQLIQAAVHNPATDGTKLNSGQFWSYQFNTTNTPYSFSNAAIPSCTAPGEPSNRHPFLLEPPSAMCGGPPGGAGSPGAILTGEAQSQLVGFLAGVAPF
ncbi:MAG: hypothetical protein ACLQDQ_12740 [Myxococcaceae bacterium]